MSDRLALANAIEAAGIERANAENIATAIAHFLEGNAATKADTAALGARIDLVEHRLLTRLGGLTVVGLTILFAALHMWPPHS
jgi:hypothetical protein